MTDWMRAGGTTITGPGGDEIEAYLAHPESDDPRGAVVLIHHKPGYDRATMEMVRNIAVAGYTVLCPNLYSREAPGEPDTEVQARCRRSRAGFPTSGSSVTSRAPSRSCGPP